jgi:ketosteroid isomerase-like protein
MQFDETFKKHDAAAIAALYTPDAVQVWDWMTGDEAVSGQQAIEKRYADDIVAGKTDYVSKLIQVNTVGDEISAISEFSLQVWKGYNVRIYVRDADTWKIHLEYAIHSMRPR